MFAIQEEVIADIIKSVTEQQALEVAPRTIDPIQQTVATAIQGYLNHPDVDRREAIDLIRFLNQPMLSIQIRELRAALRSFRAVGQAKELIEAVRRLKGIVAEPDAPAYSGAPRAVLRREDLRLICFDFLSGG
jgi:hypothetical protein